MARLFSAIELPTAVRDDLATRLSAVRTDCPGDELSWSAATGWHITVGFYGDREHPDQRGTWFRRQAATLARSRIRLRAAGQFPGVLWMGVMAKNDTDVDALRRMATALIDEGGLAESREYVPHVTVARWRRGQAGTAAAAGAAAALAGYASDWWTVDEVVLLRADSGPDGTSYVPVDRVRLAGKQR